MFPLTGRLLSLIPTRRIVAAREKVFPLFRFRSRTNFPLSCKAFRQTRDNLSQIFRDKRTGDSALTWGEQNGKLNGISGFCVPRSADAQGRDEKPTFTIQE